MLSLIELRRVAESLSENLVEGRVERWVEPDRGRLAFSIYRRGASGPDGEVVKRKCVVVLDARPGVAHCGVLAKMPKAPDSLPAFSAYLRAHLSRARLESASLRGDDRQLALRFSAASGEFTLLLSVFGRKSNLYLLDAEDRILQALRPLADTRSELGMGAAYQDPEGAAPMTGADRFEANSGFGLLTKIGERYSGEIEERSEDDDRRRLMQALKKERKSTARRVERIEAELAEAEEATTLQRNGELLKANLGRISPGDASVTVEDFETGNAVEIPLDPKRSGKENLEATFKRYQKLLRRLTKAGGQIDTARTSLAEIEALEEEARNAEDLEAILARESVKKLLGRHATKAGGVPSKAIAEKPSLPNVYRNMPRKLHPRRYVSAEGMEIWVGRSDEANDYLTTRFARGKDLFFHVDGAPGSHVILRTEGRDDPPSEAILDACELAVHFSKQKNAGRADVHVVPIKNVKKPKGAKRGLVYVTGGKSVHLRREPARLERVMAAKIDD
ncbi:MAG: NFACT RNA binding domain-containing protein [Myxococcota bacterium]